MNIKNEYKARRILQFVCENKTIKVVIKKENKEIFNGNGNELIYKNPFNFLCQINNIKYYSNKLELYI